MLQGGAKSWDFVVILNDVSIVIVVKAYFTQAAVSIDLVTLLHLVKLDFVVES